MRVQAGGQWKIVSIDYEHNHRKAQDTFSYPMNRRLDAKNRQIAVNLIEAHASNAVISETLSRRGAGSVPKDISNLRRIVFNNSPGRQMFHLINDLEENNYQVRYTITMNVNEEPMLRFIFFAHNDAIAMARQLSDVICLDATYKTNQHKLPFVNVTGTANIGSPKLKTLFIASGWILHEDNSTYEWFARCLESVVWPEKEGVTAPKIFVTDSDTSVMAALDTMFPRSHKILCQNHMRRNFESNLRKLFNVKADFNT